MKKRVRIFFKSNSYIASVDGVWILQMPTNQVAKFSSKENLIGYLDDKYGKNNYEIVKG